MSCRTYMPMLHSYINNELDMQDTLEINKHLLDCADCNKELEEIRLLKSIALAVKSDMPPLIDFKDSIMSAIKKTVKTTTFDIRILGRLGASLIACGLLAFLLSFSSLGENINANIEADYKFNIIGEKLSQPILAINKGLTDFSEKIVELNGITFKLEENR